MHSFDEEHQARRVLQRWTIAIGITGILVGLFTALFQYVTYKTDRSVTITNRQAFADTTKVLLLRSAEAQLVDSAAHESAKKADVKILFQVDSLAKAKVK